MSAFNLQIDATKFDKQLFSDSRVGYGLVANKVQLSSLASISIGTHMKRAYQ